jgi:hypothetical protein
VNISIKRKTMPGIHTLKLCTALLCVLCLVQSVGAAADSATGGKKNILFIAIDDLRPELGIYGKPLMKTPSIDQLARQGVTFSRAYSNVPVCGASRAVLMTGLRPTSTRFDFTGQDHPRPPRWPGFVEPGSVASAK